MCPCANFCCKPPHLLGKYKLYVYMVAIACSNSQAVYTYYTKEGNVLF